MASTSGPARSRRWRIGRARWKFSIPGILETTVTLALDGAVILGGPAIPSGKNGVIFVPVTLVNVKQ